MKSNMEVVQAQQPRLLSPNGKDIQGGPAVRVRWCPRVTAVWMPRVLRVWRPRGCAMRLAACLAGHWRERKNCLCRRCSGKSRSTASHSRSNRYGNPDKHEAYGGMHFSWTFVAFHANGDHVRRDAGESGFNPRRPARESVFSGAHV